MNIYEGIGKFTLAMMGLILGYAIILIICEAVKEKFRQRVDDIVAKMFEQGNLECMSFENLYELNDLVQEELHKRNQVIGQEY